MKEITLNRVYAAEEGSKFYEIEIRILPEVLYWAKYTPLSVN